MRNASTHCVVMVLNTAGCQTNTENNRATTYQYQRLYGRSRNGCGARFAARVARRARNTKQSGPAAAGRSANNSGSGTKMSAILSAVMQ
jgi:hypothetical protein